MRVALAFLFLFLGVTGVAQAKGTCESQTMAGVNVSWMTHDIKYNHTRTSGQLNNYDIDTKSPYARHVKTDVGGLMSGEIAVKSNFNFSLLRYPQRQETCIWFNQVDIKITIDPTIYIAKEHKKGTCKYHAVKHHEMKHVYVDRKLVQSYTYKIKHAVKNAVAKVGVVGPKPDNRVASTQKKMQEYLEKEIAPIIDQLYEDRRELQQNVDSIEEYERVKNQCKH